MQTWTEDRYRTIPETTVVDILTLVAWPYDFETGLGRKASQETLDLWVKNGLEFRSSPAGERLFDPVEVDNFAKRLSPSGENRRFQDAILRANRRVVEDLAARSARDGEAGARFVVHFKRTFNLRGVGEGTSLRLRAPLPLESESLRDLHVKAFAETGGSSRVVLTPGRIEVRLETCGAPEATIGAILDFRCPLQKPGPTTASAGTDRAIHLSPREGLIVVTERVAALAQALAGKSAPPLDAVRAFWNHIKDEMSNGALHYDQIDPAAPCDWILDRGWYDCQMGAVLLVALCRACAIPARVVGGFLLHEKAPAKHYWAEVWIDGQGWNPFDFFYLGTSSLGDERLWRDRFFGRLEPRMTCERLPREFVGAPGVPIPPRWCLLQTPAPRGARVVFADIEGTPIYTDTIRLMN